MADQDEDEQRKLLEEFQRQQAEQARRASQNQPNAISSEPSQPSRAVDYAQRGLVQNLEGGGFESRAPGTPFAAVQGSPLSDQEQSFWAANPNGAVKDPITGNLIGLGSTPERQKQVEESVPQRPVFVNAGLGGIGQAATPPPAQFREQVRQPSEIPNFVNIPEVDPNISARRSQIAQSIADIDRRLPSAQTQRLVRGQPSERERLIMERAHYVRADDVLANELHNQNQARTHASDLNMKMRDQYAMTQDATALREDFNKIKSKPGTPQYAQDVLNLRINHPDAMRDPRSVELLDRAARSHEEEAAFLQRAQEQGVTPQVSGFHQGRTTYTIPKPATDKFSADELKQNNKDLIVAGVNGNQFSQRTKVQRGTWDNTKNEFTPSDTGPHQLVTIGNRQIPFTLGSYERLNRAYPSTAQPTATPQPTATDSAAVTWARANPDDPRAKRILALNPQ